MSEISSYPEREFLRRSRVSTRYLSKLWKLVQGIRKRSRTTSICTCSSAITMGSGIPTNYTWGSPREDGKGEYSGGVQDRKENRKGQRIGPGAVEWHYGGGVVLWSWYRYFPYTSKASQLQVDPQYYNRSTPLPTVVQRYWYQDW